MAVIESLSVRRTILPNIPWAIRSKSVAMTFTPESGGSALSIPYAPKDVSHTDLIAEYVYVPRPGLLDNVVYSNPMRPKMSLDLKVYDKKVGATSGTRTLVRAVSVVQAIQTMARSGKRVRISYGALESGLWYITNMRVNTSHRDPVTDEITGAEVTLDLVRGDSSLGAKVGPVSGGAVTVDKPITAFDNTTTTTSVSQAPSAPSARYYTTKNGDTLWSISLKFYGDGSKWPTIGDANGLKDARKVKAGLKLRVP